MEALKNLFCIRSSTSTLVEPEREGHIKMNLETTPPGPELRCSIPELLVRLAYNGRTTEDTLQPYLEYEADLRKAFARGDNEIDGLANLIPIYAGHERYLENRNGDRKFGEGHDKYIMALPAKLRAPSDSLAIAVSLEEYWNNFQAFTHRVLKDLDWSNVVAAGSSALLPLLPHRDDIEITSDSAVEDPAETYYQVTAGTSDIDLFIYGLDEDAAIQKIIQIEATVRKNQRLTPDGGMTLRTENAITFISPRWPFRHVQVILRLYKSMSEVLTGFDVDCACVAFDGKQVYSNPRGIAAITTRTNIVDLNRRSPSYENRLFKYRRHNFDVFWSGLDRSKINTPRCIKETDPRELTGLARLIFLENIVRKYGEGCGYQQLRRLKRIQETGESTHSGYATHDVPYGERFTATKIQKYVTLNSKEPLFFGNLHEVLQRGAEATSKNQGKVTGKITFLKENPGRQMIGSFNPITEDDWTEMAYARDTA